VGRRFYEGTKLAESKARFNKGSGYEAMPAYDPTRTRACCTPPIEPAPAGCLMHVR
jgi:hypothetical protein